VRDAEGERELESLYAHFDEVFVTEGALVRRGERLGTVGTAGGQYKAHLHLELRQAPGLPLGGGYSDDRRGYLDPTAFIRAHRPR
jgi:murein DD-endopeptidase MepM/ murein hydrolase activator NlpD